MIALKWILLLPAALSLGTAKSSLSTSLLQQKRSGRDLQGAERVEAYYIIGLETSEDCRFTSATFIVECEDTAVLLDDDLNLGLAKCQNLDAKTLQCTDDSLNSFLIDDAAELVIKCVGDTESDVARVSVEIVEDSVDCSVAEGFSSISRFFDVYRVCAADSLGLILPENRNCVNSDETSTSQCQSKQVCGNFNGVPCTAGMPLPGFGMLIRDTVVPDACLFVSEPLPPLPPLSEVASGNSAEYQVNFGVRDDLTCTVDYPVLVTFQCGDEDNVGRINFLPDSQAALEGGICQQEGTSKIVCEIDPSPEELPLDLSAIINASCTGSSVEALVLEVELEPGRMFCRQLGVRGDILLSVSSKQFCTGVKSVTNVGEFANVFAQQCSPIAVEMDTSQLLDVNFDGIGDTVIPDERCTYHQGNCFDNFSCEADGSQELGTVRTRIPAPAIDLECLDTSQDLPTPTDPTDSTCVDNAKKKNVFVGIRVNGRTRDCRWLSNASNKVKKWYCANERVARKRCAACGTVTAQEENPNRSIDAYKVQKRDCAWFQGRSDTLELCRLSKDARKACKRSCGRCG